MKYKDILNNKVELMGLSMLLIMFYHSKFLFDSSLLNVVHYYGYIGVDFFLFLSGMGCLFSYRKCNSKKEFYKKRILKILPTYLPIAIVSCFLLLKTGYLNMYDFWGEITLTNFIFHIGKFPYWYWYIPSMLFMYFITPFVVDFYDRYINKKKACLILGFMAFLMWLLVLSPKFSIHYLLVGRIPIYLLGLLFGEYSYNDKVMNKSSIYTLFLLAQISIVFLIKNLSMTITWYNNTFIYLAFIFITISGCILFSLLFNYLKNRFKWMKFYILKFIGKITLEIYSMHERMIIIGLIFLGKIGIDVSVNNGLYNIIIIFITIFISWIWSKMVSWGMDTKR